MAAEIHRHCDDYIDDESAPRVLRNFLERARSPGHGMHHAEPFPVLFATYRGQAWNDIKPGDRIRVVMASRMGDVGITKNLAADHNYTVRCYVEALDDFAELP
jgi:hypothetical protein